MDLYSQVKNDLLKVIKRHEFDNYLQTRKRAINLAIEMGHIYICRKCAKVYFDLPKNYDFIELRSFKLIENGYTFFIDLCPVDKVKCEVGECKNSADLELFYIKE